MKTLDIVLYTILDVLSWLLVIRCILSFIVMAVKADFLYRIYEAVIKITDPILYPFRKILDLIPGLSRIPIDFSCFFAIMVISLLQFLL